MSAVGGLIYRYARSVLWNIGEGSGLFNTKGPGTPVFRFAGGRTIVGNSSSRVVTNRGTGTPHAFGGNPL